MLVFIAPISGGFFVNQVELMCQFLETTGEKPDIGMSTSGGNFAMYLALLSEWDHRNIREKIMKLDDSFIVREWSKNPLIPREVWGFIYGSMYDRGKGDPFTYDPAYDLAAATEVWTTAFNRTQNLTAYFTNKAIGKTHLTFTTPYVPSLPLRFVNGNYTQLKDIALASAAVPGVQREMIIDGESYYDGGMQYASPFMAFQDNLRDLSQTQPMHIVYFHCVNLARPTAKSTKEGILADAHWAVSQLTSGHIAGDIAAVITFLRSVPGFTALQTREWTTGSRDAILATRSIRATSRATVTELYPLHNRSIDYTSFTALDVESVMNICRQDFCIRMHWTQ